MPQKIKLEPTLEAFDPTATTFEGIPHYETWTVLSWIKEHEGAADFWHGEASRVYLQTREFGDPVVKLSELLEQRHTDRIPGGTGVYGDLIRATLRRVKWREVAVALLADVGA